MCCCRQQGQSFFLSDDHGLRLVLQLNFALEDGDLHLIRAGAEPHLGIAAHQETVIADHQAIDIVALGPGIEINQPFDHLYLIDLNAGIIHQKLGKLYFRVFRQAQRALVLELDLRQSITASNQARAFDDWGVQDGALQTFTGGAIHLNLSFDRAETNDPDMRVGDGGDRACKQNERCDGRNNVPSHVGTPGPVLPEPERRRLDELVEAFSFYSY